MESDEHDLLRAAFRVVCNDLEVLRPEGTSSIVARTVDITARVRQLKREALRSRITQAFTISYSHYDESINLETMSLGFVPGYKASELDQIEAAVASLAQDLASRFELIVLPRRG